MRRQGCLAILALRAWAVANAHRGGLALSQAGLQRQQALEVSWARELASSKASVNPVRRVIDLLGKMKEQLTAEAETESETYDKMVCWCETGEKEKTQAVKDADARDVALVSDIEGRSARFGGLSTEIADLKAQIAEDTQSLSRAAGIRENAMAAASDDEKSMTQAVTNLRNSIVILERHHGSLLQLSPPLISSFQVLLRDVGSRYSALVASQARHSIRAGEESEEDLPQTAFLALAESTHRAGEQARQRGIGRSLLSALMGRNKDIPDVPLHMAEHLIARSARSAAGRGIFLQVAGGYAENDVGPAPAPTDVGPAPAPSPSRSGEVLGVLRRLLAEFEEQLSNLHSDEGSAQDQHQELSDTKRQQIELAKEKLDILEADAASNRKALSDAKAELEATRRQRSADSEFLANLRQSCGDLDADWERRSKTRTEELKAVTEAISTLTEDDNRETMARSLSLLQQGTGRGMSTRTMARRARAAAALGRAASDDSLDVDDLLASWHSRRHSDSSPASRRPSVGPRVRLATLATAVRIDSFTKVKEMMDKMVAQLQKQQTDDVKLKDYCTKELNQNEQASARKSDEKKGLETKLDLLVDSLSTLEQEINEATAQISQTEDDLKKASGTREKENLEFQATVADQRATQEILKKALRRLKDFYSKGIGNEAAAPPAPEPAAPVLLQKASQMPPEQFAAYKTNGGASPVISLLEQILEDSKRLEAEATANERRSQADYETFAHGARALAAELADSIDLKVKAKADVKLEKAETESGLESARTELESLTAYESDLHSQCDFLLKNFALRQKARLKEMEAIQSAKGILSGAEAQ